MGIDKAVPRVAKYIQDTIQQFREVNSQLRPQTPPIDNMETDTDQRLLQGHPHVADHITTSMQPPTELSSPGRNGSSNNASSSWNPQVNSIDDNDHTNQTAASFASKSSSKGCTSLSEEEDGGISSCSDNSNVPPVVHDTNADGQGESAEDRYNRLRETCSVASSNNSSSPSRCMNNSNARGQRQQQQPIPLLEKMRRVDFFQSNVPLNNKNDMVRRGSGMIDAMKKLQQGSTNERLYNDAFKSKERKNRVVAKARADEKKELAGMQWEMNEGSKRIMKNYEKSNELVGDRLYQQRLKEKEKRLNFISKEIAEYEESAEAHQLEINQHVNNWSCAKCGTYHTLKSANIKASVRLNDVKKVCDNPQCKDWGLDQSKREPFKVIYTYVYAHVKIYIYMSCLVGNIHIFYPFNLCILSLLPYVAYYYNR